MFPVRVDAHSLPFAKEFFDAVVAIDSYLYFGTDERYLPYIVQFIKPDGFIGVVDIGFRREIRSIEEAPEYLRLNTRSIGRPFTLLNGGSSTGRRQGWWMCSALSFCLRATGYCAIIG